MEKLTVTTGVDRSAGWSIPCQMDAVLDWLLDKGLDRYIYMSLESSLYWYKVLVAHVKYDMGEFEMGVDNSVAARIVI